MSIPSPPEKVRVSVPIVTVSFDPLSAAIVREEEIAAVDAEDKVLGYRNWLSLMKGNLTSKFKKNSLMEIENELFLF